MDKQPMFLELFLLVLDCAVLFKIWATWNAAMSGKYSQRHTFNIIFDGFDKHTAPPESCNTVVFASWNRDQGSWAQRQGCVNIWTSDWGSYLARWTLGFPTTLDVNNKTFVSCCTGGDSTQKEKKVLLDGFPALLGGRKWWWKHSPTEKTHSCCSFLFLSTPAFTFLHKSRASSFSAELLKKRMMPTQSFWETSTCSYHCENF